MLRAGGKTKGGGRGVNTHIIKQLLVVVVLQIGFLHVHIAKVVSERNQDLGINLQQNQCKQIKRSVLYSYLGEDFEYEALSFSLAKTIRVQKHAGCDCLISSKLRVVQVS